MEKADASSATTTTTHKGDNSVFGSPRDNPSFTNDDGEPQSPRARGNGDDVANGRGTDVTAASQLTPPAYPALFAAGDRGDPGPVSRDSSAGGTLDCAGNVGRHQHPTNDRTVDCAGNVGRHQHPRNDRNNNSNASNNIATTNTINDCGSDASGAGEVTPRDVRLEGGEGAVTSGGEGRRRRRMLRFNIGGTLFQTKEATIDSQDWQEKGVKLANRDFLSRFYDEDEDEYFLDRDPDVFNSVLNLLRSGRLHIPSSMCGQHAKEELQFWGVSPLQVEPCCWSKLNSWNATRENLKLLEHDVLNIRGSPREDDSCCSRCKIVLWRTLTDPAYSLVAKIYGWISFFFVLMAIFSFCASTHPLFRVPISTPHSVDPYDVTGTPDNSTTLTNATSTTTLPPTTPMYKTVSERLRETEVHPALQYVDYLCLAFFTLEYIIKLVTSPRKLRFLRSFKGIIDLLAIAPDYVEIFLLILDPDALTENGFVVLFMPFLRVARAFRIFRLFRHLPGLWIMVYTIQSSYKDLFLMFAFLMVGTLLFASLVFFIDDKETFTSIPHGFWWAIVTMTTVGYGDMYPVTAPGYVLGSVTAISGVLMIGFTIPALVNNFILYYEHVQFVREKAKLTKEFEAEERARRDEEERELEEKLAREEEEEERQREREEREEKAKGEETGRETDRKMTDGGSEFQERYTRLSV